MTQPRSVSGLIPSCCPIRGHAPTRVSGSCFASSTIRTARSRSSSGYFLGATIYIAPPSLTVSIKPGAGQGLGGRLPRLRGLGPGVLPIRVLEVAIVRGLPLRRSVLYL